MRIATNYEQRNSTNFKALKEVKFNGVFQKNYDAQRILLDAVENNQMLKKINQMYDTSIKFHPTGLSYSSNNPSMAIWYSTKKDGRKESFFTKLYKFFTEPDLLEIIGKRNYLATTVDAAKSISEALQTPDAQKELEILIEKETQYSDEFKKEVENQKSKLINK